MAEVEEKEMGEVLTGEPGSAPGELLIGRISGRVKGGVEVETPNGPGFCSLRQTDERGGETASSLIGNQLEFAVLGRRPDGVLLLSRRRLLEQDRQQGLAEAATRFVPGARLRARVVRVSEHGAAVVVLGAPGEGLEGHIRREELAHGRVLRPGDLLYAGQEIEAEVRRFDPRSGSLSLSRKAVLPEPWKEAERELPRGCVVEGQLLRAAEFGVFIEIRAGVEGLLHREEVPEKAWEALAAATAAGATMLLLVFAIDSKRRRAELLPAPAGLEPGQRFVWPNLRRGDVIEAPVERIDREGLWIDLGPGRHGFVDRRELGSGEQPENFKPGQVLRLEIGMVERGGREVQLSRKRAVKRDERQVVDEWRRENGPAALNTLGALLEKARSERIR